MASNGAEMAEPENAGQEWNMAGLENGAPQNCTDKAFFIKHQRV